MSRIAVLTIFPELFDSFLSSPVIKRAEEKKILQIEIKDIREYAKGSYRHIDDSPYGGGAGMLMRCQPVLDCLHDVKTSCSHVIALTPAGIPYSQKKAHELAGMEDVILICGHYEGMDQRIYDEVDEEISIGDYILTGGELPAMAVIDSIARLKKDVLRKESTIEESFEKDLLEYPQYTKPYAYHGKAVPDVLLSGDHEKIRIWRHRESLRATLHKRPDLLKEHAFTEEEKILLKQIQEEEDGLKGNQHKGN